MSQRGFVIAEVGFVIGLIMIVVAGKEKWTYEVRSCLGWIAMGTIISGIVACWVNFFIELIPQLIHKIKMKCKNAKKPLKKAPNKRPNTAVKRLTICTNLYCLYYVV